MQKGNEIGWFYLKKVKKKRDGLETQNDDNTRDTRMVKLKDIYKAFDAKGDWQYLMAPELRNSFLTIKQ